MQELFNVSERFSRALDDVRGPKRKKRYLRQAQAWVAPSGARRAVASALSYGGIGLILGTMGIALFKNRDQFRKTVTKLKGLVYSATTSIEDRDRTQEKLAG